MFDAKTDEAFLVLKYVKERDRDGKPITRKRGEYAGTVIERVEVLTEDGSVSIPLHPSVNGERVPEMTKAHLVLRCRVFGVARQVQGQSGSFAVADTARDYDVIGFTPAAATTHQKAA